MRFGASKNGITRRDALKFIGGGTLGTLLTPLPWKLLDDVAIWTQNGSHIMHVPRGTVTTKMTHCTLCPAVCGLRVRCSGGRPVGIAGVSRHPRSLGTVCPLGLAAHHLSFHPHRATTALWRATPEAPARQLKIAAAVQELEGWVAAAQEHGGRGAVVILDARPERAVSSLYRTWLGALGCGTYVLPPGDASVTFDMMLYEPVGPIGFDLGRVRTVIAFGAPGLDGWTRRQAAGEPDSSCTWIQVESRPSRTALQAEHWLQPRPGSETALAFGLANVILSEGLLADRASTRQADDFDIYRDFVAGFTVERVAATTGIDARTICDTARRLACDGPAVVLAGVDPGAGPLATTAAIAIWGLNLLVGGEGGCVVRRRVPTPQGLSADPEFVARDLTQVPDGSVQVLIVDANAASSVLPWPLVQRKLAPTGHVACLSAFDAGIAHRAHLLLPTAPLFEAWDEAPSAPDAAVASYGVSAPLRPPRTDCVDPVTLVLQLAARTTPGALPTPDTLDTETLLRQRAAAIAASGRGAIFDCTSGATTPVATLSAASCDEALRQGGCWLDDAAPQPELPRFSLLGREPELRARLLQGEWQRQLGAPGTSPGTLTLVPFATAGAGLGVLPPVLAKLHRESELFDACGVAFVHPSTARECGVDDGDWGCVETRRGRATVRLRTDAAVRPGVLHVAVGADGWAFGDGKSRSIELLEICDVAADGTWRTTPATLRRA